MSLRVAPLLALCLLVSACAGAQDGPAPVAPVISPDRTPVVRAPTAAVSAAAPSPASAAPAAPISVLLTRQQCLSCHAVGQEGQATAGNRLDGLAERIATYPTTQDPAAYVRAALLDPGSFLAPACPTGPCANVMPSYAGRLSPEELDLLVAYLLSLPPATEGVRP